MSEKILTAASGGERFTVGNGRKGQFMAFKAVNGNAVIKLNQCSNFRNMTGVNITILEGDVHWYWSTDFDVIEGEVLAYDTD